MSATLQQPSQRAPESGPSSSARPARRSFLRDCWTVLTSSHVATALGVVTSYVVRHTLTPGLVGIWSAVRLVLDYAGFADLGAARAAAVEIAVATGGGDRTRAERTVHTTMAIEVAAASVVSVLLLVAAAVSQLRGRPDWALAFVATAVLLFVRRALTLALTTLRSSLDFTVPAWSRIVGAVLELFLLAGGAVAFGLVGLLAGAIAAEIANLTFVLRARRLSLWPRWHRQTAARLVRQGAPLAAGALALMAVRSAERAMVILCAADGEVLLGLYTTSLLIASRVFDQANLVSNVLFPRMGIRLAETNDTDQVLELGLRGATLLTMLLVPIAAGAAVVGVPLTAWLLPRYRVGLEAVWGALAAATIVGGTLPLRHALVTLGHSWRMCAAYAFAAIAGASGTFAALRLLPGSLPAIGWAAALSSLAAGLLLGVATTWSRRRLLPSFAALVLAILYAAAVLAALSWLAGFSWWHVVTGATIASMPPGVTLLWVWYSQPRQPGLGPGRASSMATQAAERE